MSLLRVVERFQSLGQVLSYQGGMNARTILIEIIRDLNDFD